MQTGQTTYVSRAGDKLASVADKLKLEFRGKIVLDVGSSTGGFTDFALNHGAVKVIAVDAGSNQLHPSLRTDSRIELHEKTDIRSLKKLEHSPDLVVIDVSFISIREILPHVAMLVPKSAMIVSLLKPQFEAQSETKHKGVIKNEAMRRLIFKDFEMWAKRYYKIVNKADSLISGAKGNKERFYLLHKLS